MPLKEPVNHFAKIAPSLSSDCPNKITACPDDSSCCKMSTGGYNCCPLTNAVSCDNDEHCCPSHYTCSVKNNCTDPSGQNHIPFYTRFPTSNVTNLHFCPDKTSRCTSHQTCCEMTEGFGCCGISNAVCCANKKYCCPSDSTCDEEKQLCVKK